MAAQPGTARCAGPGILIMTDASVSIHLQGHQIFFYSGIPCIHTITSVFQYSPGLTGFKLQQCLSSCVGNIIYSKDELNRKSQYLNI